jgi:hypothetical protein
MIDPHDDDTDERNDANRLLGIRPNNPVDCGNVFAFCAILDDRFHCGNSMRVPSTSRRVAACAVGIELGITLA